jgi:hypothetical protein
VGLEAGFIDLSPETTKTGDGRRVPILAGDMNDLLTVAKRFRDANWPSCQWLFHRSGERIVDFRTAWANATKSAGVPDLLFHDIRRTAVRNMRRDRVAEAKRKRKTGGTTKQSEPVGKPKSNMVKKPKSKAVRHSPRKRVDGLELFRQVADRHLGGDAEKLAERMVAPSAQGEAGRCQVAGGAGGEETGGSR